MLSPATRNDRTEGSTEPGVQLSLIIPVYNEAPIIVANITELKGWMRDHLPGITFEILIIDDGSTDGTGDLVGKEASSDAAVRLVRHPINIGRGRGVRTGFENSRGEYIICLDADLSYSPEHIPALLDPLRRNEADITLASPFHPEGQISNVPFSRALLSRWGNRILSAGVHGRIHTVTCIVRGYRRNAIEQLELINDGKDLHLEIVQKAMLFGLRLKEVPAHLKWRNRSRKSGRKGNVLSFIPFLSMSGTVTSHLIYNYVLRPGSLLNIPVIGLLLTSLGLGAGLFIMWVQKMLSAPNGVSVKMMLKTLRDTLIEGSLSLAILCATLLISLIFLAFYFASQQSKKNFEELYILVSRMNARIKHLEKMIDG